MATQNELERIAAAAGVLRPDWPTRSLLTFLSRDHAHRPYRDLAVALVYVATDPTTKTPRRLSEAGPWWSTTRPDTSAPDDQPGRIRCVDHPWERASNCRACRSEAIAAHPSEQEDRLAAQGIPRAKIREILAAALDGGGPDGD